MCSRPPCPQMRDCGFTAEQWDLLEVNPEFHHNSCMYKQTLKITFTTKNINSDSKTTPYLLTTTKQIHNFNQSRLEISLFTNQTNFARRGLITRHIFIKLLQFVFRPFLSLYNINRGSSLIKTIASNRKQEVNHIFYRIKGNKGAEKERREIRSLIWCYLHIMFVLWDFKWKLALC